MPRRDVGGCVPGVEDDVTEVVLWTGLEVGALAVVVTFPAAASQKEEVSCKVWLVEQHS